MPVCQWNTSQLALTVNTGKTNFPKLGSDGGMGGGGGLRAGGRTVGGGMEEGGAGEWQWL